MSNEDDVSHARNNAKSLDRLAINLKQGQAGETVREKIKREFRFDKRCVGTIHSTASA
jgi:hypothetical protein